MEEGQAPRRSSLATLLLLILALGGSAAGVTVYQFIQGSKNSALPDTSGFDIAAADEAGHGPSLPGRGAQGPASSSLGMVKPGMEGLQFGAKTAQQAQTAAPKASGAFTQAIRASEAKVRALAIAYTKKHPSIAAFGRDWMASPELKKLNDDYMKNHDPIAFMKAAARSKDFAAMVKKYSGDPAIQGFVKESASNAPPGLISSAMSLLKDDSTLKALVSNVAGALGMPPSLLAGFMGGDKVDEKKIMGQIMTGNPEIQKALQGAR